MQKNATSTQKADGPALSSAKQPRRLDADLLTRDDVERIIRACSRRSPTGRRNAALIATAWRCGLRASELTALHSKDIDLAGGRLVVQRGKGGKRRVVGLDVGASALIERWIQARRMLKVKPESPLFCTLRGGQMDTSYLRHLFPRLARRAGVERRVHPHALRHRFSVDLIEDGASLLDVQTLLGHASAATTSLYLVRIGASGSIDFHRQRQWSLT